MEFKLEIKHQHTVYNRLHLCNTKRLNKIIRELIKKCNSYVWVTMDYDKIIIQATFKNKKRSNIFKSQLPKTINQLSTYCKASGYLTQWEVLRDYNKWVFKAMGSIERLQQRWHKKN